MDDVVTLKTALVQLASSKAASTEDARSRNKQLQVALERTAERIQKDRTLIDGVVDVLGKALAGTISRTSKEIEALCSCPEEEYDAADMISWGNLRISALKVVSFLVSNESRCIALFPVMIDSLVALLRSKSAKTDFVGVRAACNIVRNLTLPLQNRALVWKVRGAFNAILGHANHKDPNTTLAAAITVRQLSSSPLLVTEGVDQKAAANVISDILNKEEKHVHPTVRVELSRGLGLLLAAVGDERESTSKLHEGLLSVLSSDRCLEFICFLLASRSAPLHGEAMRALNGAAKLRSMSSTTFQSHLEKLNVAVNGVSMSIKSRISQLEGKS